MSDSAPDDQGILDPVAAAEAAGLRHASDQEAGIRRTGRTRPRYRWPNGRPVRDPDTLARIAALAIPPAWKDVWISCDAASHLQATGRDARGRKQYRYHDDWTEARSESKFSQLSAFATALPDLRSETGRALRRRRWDKGRVVALGVRLLDITAMRVGNEEYAEENGAYGLTTLLPEHDHTTKRRVCFVFPAKGGGICEVAVVDPTAARLVTACRAVGGETLLSWRADGGVTHSLKSRDVNAYLADYGATAKLFRTWAGSVAALRQRMVDPSSDPSAVVAAVDAAAEHLGNTRAVARSSYVHPAVLEVDEAELRLLARSRRGSRGLSLPERALVGLLGSAP
jgi:DNA topoisomerase-1